jgi:outer membrane immunogenic protein
MRNRVLLAAAGLLALTASAGAADLPRRYDPVPQRAPAYMPVYNWTGFYLGINGGGGWGNSRWDSTGDFTLSGGLIGGTIGYNWQFTQWVFGLEGDLDWSGIRGTTTAACVGGCTTRNTWLSTVRGRVGYSVDRFLPFITGGLAIGDIRATQPGFAGATQTDLGWTLGGGLEFVIAGNWTAKAEYLYVDLGKFNCGIACNGANPNNVSFTTHIARGGVNFRF